MMDELFLLPRPRQIEFSGENGRFSLTPNKLIALDGGTLFTARRLQTAVRQHAGLDWEIVAGTAVPHNQIGVVLSLTPHATLHEQGYQLTVTETAVYIVASSPSGLFYGVGTLIQLIAQGQTTLPQCRITDWPDIPNRGVMLDISRNKVPTMDTLYALVDKFASW
ncbi:MAG: beta-N-acetylhexosaminidase, partial [Anaerolineales bacterium]|nr:beta-N-acetylhexosaminidase [Anaerolineales bacterium]